MTEEVKPEMGQTQEQPSETLKTEMVTLTRGELEEIRSALKKANGEAAKHRKAAEQFEADQKAKAEAEMTATQKAEKRAAELEAQVKQLQRTHLQTEIAAKVGLPAKLATRLQGETAEEMEADAKEILETLPKPAKPAPGINPANPGANGAQNNEAAEAARIRAMRQQAGDPFAGGGVVWRDQNPRE